MKFNPGHYLAVAQGQRETYPMFEKRLDRYLKVPEVAGIKLQVSWKSVEPKRDQYDFAGIDRVAARAWMHSKRVVIEVMDRVFGGGCTHIRTVLPLYIVEAGWYFATAKKNSPAGKCMPKAFEPGFTTRRIALLRALALKYDQDPAVEMIQAFNESALGQPADGSFKISPRLYADQLIRIMEEVPKLNTRHMASINFLAGPDSVHVRRLIEAAVANRVAISWPDANLGQTPNQMKQWTIDNPGLAVVAPDADSTFMRYDVKTKKGDVPETLDFYVNQCGANYIFWQPVFAGRNAPADRTGLRTYFEDHIVASLRAAKGAINTKKPAGW